MMANKATHESQAAQSERFRKTVQELVDAGELNPTEADERFETVMRKLVQAKSSPLEP